MIRKNVTNFKLIVKDFSDSFSVSSRYSEFLKTFNVRHEVCPSCGATGNCRIHGYYKRYIVDINNGKIVTARIRICRVICSCGHTHAILNDSIVAYRQYSLAFILHVLRIYFSHSHPSHPSHPMSVAAICSSFNLVSATIYRWKDVFCRHKSLWLKRIADDTTAPLVFLDSLLKRAPFSIFSDSFFRKTLLSFLQSHANPANCCRAIPGWPFSWQPTT